jgi:hypothetical protein
MDDFWLIFTILHHFACYVQTSDYNNRSHLHGWRLDDNSPQTNACWSFACTALLLMRSAQIIRTGSHFHGWFFDDFSHEQENRIYLTLDCICLYCLMECRIVETSKASQPTKQTNEQECHDFECLLLPLDNNYFAFDCEKLFSEDSSKLGLLSGGPPLSLFDMLLTRGGGGGGRGVGGLWVSYGLFWWPTQ